MKYIILLAAAILVAEAAIPTRRDVTPTDPLLPPIERDAVTIIINPNVAQLYTYTSIDSGANQTHYKNFDFKVPNDGNCVYVCFAQMTNFNFLDLYQKDKTSASQTVIEGVLLSNVGGPVKQPGSIVQFEDKFKLGNQEAGAGPLSDPILIQNIPAFHACSTLAGGGMHIAFNAIGKTNTVLRMYVAGTFDKLRGLGGSCPAAQSIPVINE